MKITDIKYRPQDDGGRLKAVVSVIFDGSIAVHDIKIIGGDDRLFLAMPSRRMPDGRFRDIVHPINAQTREYIEGTVLRLYTSAQQGSGECDGITYALYRSEPFVERVLNEASSASPDDFE